MAQDGGASGAELRPRDALGRAQTEARPTSPKPTSPRRKPKRTRKKGNGKGEAKPKKNSGKGAKKGKDKGSKGKGSKGKETMPVNVPAATGAGASLVLLACVISSLVLRIQLVWPNLSQSKSSPPFWLQGRVNDPSLIALKLVMRTAPTTIAKGNLGLL